MKHNTTIAAISTPPGVGGIAVLRISGPDARAVCARVFRPVKGDVETMPGYTCLYGRVFDGDDLLDDGVLTCFAAPKSYTGEDVMELSVHGGSYLPGRILQALLQNGAVAAGRGEFTRRALENGKLSLTQAESVMELIASDGAMSAKAARAALDGALYQKLRPMIDLLLQVSAHLAAYIDFPEEDVPELAADVFRSNIASVQQSLTDLLDAERTNRQMLHGIRAAIVGRPNVGKSSLMNLLAGYRRSIVTDAPGTTRDVVEEFVSLDGLVLRLADTAGIRQTDDPIEAEGVKLAETRLSSSDLVLAVFDRSEPLTDADRRVLQQCRDVSRETPVVVVLNKSDLADCKETAEAAAAFRWSVTVSAKEGSGADALWDAIREATQTAALDPSAAMLANERQKAAARDAQSALNEALSMLDAGWTLDVCSVPVSEALDALMTLSGERADETTIDAVFETFCVGK